MAPEIAEEMTQFLRLLQHKTIFEHHRMKQESRPRSCNETVYVIDLFIYLY